MGASEDKNIKETSGIRLSAAVNSAKSYNPGLKALLYIKKNTASLEKACTELQQIENELVELNKKGLLIIETNTSPEASVHWKSIIQEFNKAVTGLTDVLTVAKEKISQKEKDGYPDLWKQLTLQITALKDHSKNATDSGLAILPDAIRPEWEKEFAEPETTLLESYIEKAETCRVLVQVIERYTPEELNSLTQIIADHVPADFTYEEAVEYQKGYYIALLNFKQEFKKDKNLWDKFLDILAGDTHQLPSEGVMMERWLDGEEAEP